MTDATVIRIGELVGASQVIVGTPAAQRQRPGRPGTRAIALDVGRVQSDVTEGAEVSDLFSMFERIAHRINSPTSAAVINPARAHPPVAAFESIKERATRRTPATALNYLNAALKAEADLDRARLAVMRDICAEQGGHARALAAVAPIGDTSDVSRRARFLAGLSQLNLQRYDAAFTTFKALADAAPSAAVFNNLGVIQLRRGGTAQSGLATYYFNKAAEAGGDRARLLFSTSDMRAGRRYMARL